MGEFVTAEAARARFDALADQVERPLYLGRQTRIATVNQRIICYARDTDPPDEGDD